jgi:uncharacterized protein (TIGR03067 family)
MPAGPPNITFDYRTFHAAIFAFSRPRIREKGVTIYEGLIGVDASANPRAMDFKHKGGSSRGKTWRGIYRIDGDTLTICDNAADVQKSRPTSFDTKPNSGRVLVVFRRAPR